MCASLQQHTHRNPPRVSYTKYISELHPPSQAARSASCFFGNFFPLKASKELTGVPAYFSQAVRCRRHIYSNTMLYVETTPDTIGCESGLPTSSKLSDAVDTAT